MDDESSASRPLLQVRWRSATNMQHVRQNPPLHVTVGIKHTHPYGRHHDKLLSSSRLGFSSATGSARPKKKSCHLQVSK